MSLMRRGLRLAQALVLVAGAAFAALPASAADFAANSADLAEAMAALKAKIGPHPRALSVSIEPSEVAIEAQSAGDPRHVDLWRYVVRRIGPFTMKSASGPSPVSLNLLDPDLDANLFDLDEVDFPAAGRLVVDSIRRAGLQDAATVASMEIKREIAIIPRPTAGAVRWTVQVRSARERASITADAKGTILGADLQGTRRAQTVDLFREPELVVEAAAAFRARVSPGPVLTSVSIEAQGVGFRTNLKDKALGGALGMRAVEQYGWTLGGLARMFGTIATPVGALPQAEPFAVDDVDWTVVARLAPEALKRVEAPGARITEISIEKKNDRPGGTALTWRIDIRDGEGERSQVFADLKGAILEVAPPEGRQQKPNWLEPTTIAKFIANVGATFGADVRIASIVIDDRGARVTVDEKGANAPATYDFNGRAFNRAPFSFPTETTGPRFAFADASRLDAAALERLEADALARLAGKRKAYLESVHLGPQMFAPAGGAKAMEIRIRDREVDSAQAQYGWIIYSFDGRALDSSPM